MGKLVLTRRAGESVKLVEANGDTWTLTMKSAGSRASIVILRPKGTECSFRLGEYESCTFAGGSLELRPTKRRWPDQAVLAFDFPRDVKIVRTEIA